MHILNAEPSNYSRVAHEILASIGKVTEKNCDRNNLLTLVPEVDVLIVRLGHRVDQEVFSRARKLKVVVTATTGLNHIDLVAAASHGVTVLSLKGERTFLDSLSATAEMTWALLLSLIRKVPFAMEHVNRGEWDRDKFKGNQLKGKVLGIIGYGRLGSIVASYGQVFGMRVIATDPHVVDMAPYVEKVELQQLLSAADVISLHVNYDESTHGIIDEKAFQQVKAGALLINTSRGELIDEKAMLDALDTERLGGIALDVLANESGKTSNWLKSSEIWQRAIMNSNVIITPHIGGATIESMEETEIFMANKLVSFIAKEFGR